jgi:hypothetical protein
MGTRFAVFHSPQNKEHGPDLGFLRLPEMNASNFKATHSFLDLKKSASATELEPPFLDCVVGVVGEWTEDLDQIKPLDPSLPALRRKRLRATLSVGKAAAIRLLLGPETTRQKRRKRPTNPEDTSYLQREINCWRRE